MVCEAVAGHGKKYNTRITKGMVCEGAMDDLKAVGVVYRFTIKGVSLVLK